MYVVSGLAAAFSLLQAAVVNQFQGLIIILFCAAAWIGVQHLGYREFGIARQVFMKGTFRRVIDDYTRLQHLETNLTHAASIEDMWKVLVKGAEEFGYSEVRMDYMGLVRICKLEPVPERRWVMTVSLPRNQYVELSRGFHPTAPGSNIIGDFVRLIETALTARYYSDPEFVPQIPAPVIRVARTAAVQTASDGCA
jgi:UDP-GlcNAc:undecaprenyl-phosphate GlcNAc-1-phosphate transferase